MLVHLPCKVLIIALTNQSQIISFGFDSASNAVPKLFVAGNDLIVDFKILVPQLIKAHILLKVALSERLI